MKISLIGTVSLLLFFCGFAAVSNIFAATLTVTKTTDTADGVCDADCSLREAVIAANSGDVIVFSPLFNSPQTIPLTGGQITINKNLTIAGPSADLLTVSGNNAGRIFYISNNAVVTLAGMKLKNGRATTLNDSFGGAIRLTDSTLILTNMTLSQNSASFTISGNPTLEVGFGGAISSFNSTVSVINSIINDNFSFVGGGIYSVIGIVNISNSKINNNSGGGVVGAGSGSDTHTLINVVNSTFNGNNGSAVSGGNGRISVINSTVTNNYSGIANGSGGILTIDRTIIGNNSGNGVFNHGAATISKTTIDNNTDNSVSGNGGGINNTGNMTINDSTISNNKSGRTAGGILNAGQLTLTNSTVSGNLTALVSNYNGSGGGIYNTLNGNLILTNSTITNNRATGDGGGLRHDGSGTVTLRNTIIAGNSSGGFAEDVAGTIVSQGFNLISDTTGSSGWINLDLLNRNPLLAPLGNNGGLTLTHALMPGSPAIDAGNNALAKDPTTNLELLRDQRGYARFMGGISGNGIVDIGAYESNIADSPVTLSGRVLTNTGRGVDKAQVTLTDANGTVVYAQTNPFGYYRFVNLPPGMTYTITVIHKRYQFNSPQVVTIENNRSDLNFIASL
ncbi:MAG: choice-of-anchor Q domain-containing protein [Pyrinomonadaceae bacterium]